MRLGLGVGLRVGLGLGLGVGLGLGLVRDERASRAQRDGEASARVAAVRVEGEARHVRPDGAEELAELGVVTQHVRRAEAVEDLVRVKVGVGVRVKG